MEIFTRQIFTEPVGEAKPMRFRGYIIPEYIRAYFYVIDNDGIKVTNTNFKQFNTWTIELILKVTKAETVDIIQQTMRGSQAYKGHQIFRYPTPAFIPSEYGTVKARHFNELQANRVRLISHAVQVAIQSNVYKKSKSGGHSWTVGDRVDISEKDLKAINTEVVNFSYSKLDGTFYETFAERYRKVVRDGDRTPIKTLQSLYYSDKSLKHVQSYATTCRKKGLLPKADKGKNSPIRKSNTKGKGK